MERSQANQDNEKELDLSVAVIGLAGKFPQAKNLVEFWQNLKQGKDCITFFSDEELLKAGASPDELRNPNYIKAKGIIVGIEDFDAKFFGYSPKEAELIDPQIRLIHECAYEALENAGCDTERHRGLIGVYVGAQNNNPWINRAFQSGQLEGISTIEYRPLVEKDFLATRIAYQLNLRGPAFSVDATCSTSLVAVHVACRALLTGECDLALAGGVDIRYPQTQGYLYYPGNIYSRNGQTRTFDINATGTVFGNGAGIAVLKRLKDALADGDNILAVVKSTAINNNGYSRGGFLASSIDGQTRVIKSALEIANIKPETISYVEAHGTATDLGDTVEVEALKESFRPSIKKYCAIGSVKSNIGHTGTAAGVAGFIKTVLALQHKLIPASLNFKKPNPKIDFKNSPFYVVTKPTPWKRIDKDAPLRAGVSSFGIGGTNAHVILEEAPRLKPSDSGQSHYLFVLSAKTQTALNKMIANLIEHLTNNPNINLADAAWTLQTGRTEFNYRATAVSKNNIAAAIEKLKRSQINEVKNNEKPKVVFMFTGQGAQCVNVGRELYEAEPIFRRYFDGCFDIIKEKTGIDMKKIIYPAEPSDKINQTKFNQPLLFSFEYTLASFLKELGLKPDIFIGHSVGEITAACLAGVLSLEDALEFIIQREKLVANLPAGLMLAISVSADQIKPIIKLFPEISLAAANSPRLCVASGPKNKIIALDKYLKKRGYFCKKLAMDRAFHSAMMDSALNAFAAAAKKINFAKPVGRLVSTVSGDWAREQEITDFRYWVKQLRQPVYFEKAASKILTETEEAIFIEIGPGNELATFLRQNKSRRPEHRIFSFFADGKKTADFLADFLSALGRFWQAGIKINFELLYQGQRRRKISLPTYPFSRQRYWPQETKTERLPVPPEVLSLPQPSLAAKPALADLFSVPVWEEKKLPAGRIAPGYLIICDDLNVGKNLAKRLKNAKIIKQNQNYLALFKKQGVPANILHLASLDDQEHPKLNEKIIAQASRRGFYDLLTLAQALGQMPLTKKISLRVFTNQLQCEAKHPEQSLILGPVKVIPGEYPDINCQNIDIDLNDISYQQIVREVLSPIQDKIVALRSGRRYAQAYKTQKLEITDKNISAPIKKDGTYLVTGGLGAIGLTLAEHFSKKTRVNLVLVSRTPPDNQKLKRIKELRKNGARVLIISADVTNYRQMNRVIKKINRRFGAINGVIHAAGNVDNLGVIQNRHPEKTQKNISAKIQGTIILKQLCPQTDFFFLCSSISSILAPAGEVGYVAANSFLDYFAQNQNQSASPTLTVSVNWPSWQEIGMAVNSRRLSASGLKPVKLSRHHLFDKHLADKNLDVFIGHFSPQKNWFWGQHKIAGKPTVPGVCWLEFVWSALNVMRDRRQLSLNFTDVQIIEPLSTWLPREIRIIIKKINDQHFEFISVSRLNAKKDLWQMHVTGGVHLIPQKSQPTFYNVNRLTTLCPKKSVLPIQYYRPGNFWEFGPRWQGPTKMYRGKNQSIVEASLTPQFRSDLNNFNAHPALFDLAVGFFSVRDSVLPIIIDNNNTYLPFAYKNVRIYSPLPAKIVAYAKFFPDENNDQNILNTSIVIMNKAGRVLIEVDGFINKKVEIGQRLELARDSKKTEHFPKNQNFYLGIKNLGILETLSFYPSPRKEPTAEQIEAKIELVGMNFMDIAKAMGIAPFNSNNAADQLAFGSECAGIVTKVGRQVKGFKVGDKVIVVMAKSGFGRFITADYKYVIKKPANLTLKQAVTVPVAFLTAYYSLIKQGRLKKGEKILIHSAAGGVGLAAVQIARWAGAEIFATAGSEEKRQYLRSLGIKHVMDSRTLNFADEIMQLTNNQGVDVVLNSLAGEFIPKSLAVLAEFGRFLEIGKRDVQGNTNLGLKLLEKNITFCAIDLYQKIVSLRSVLKEVISHFTTGDFKPLPSTIFPLAKTKEAFAYMQQAKHIGKIIISLGAEKDIYRAIKNSGQETLNKNLFSFRDVVEPLRDLSENQTKPHFAITPAEGVSIFDLVMGNKNADALAQIIISGQKLMPVENHVPQSKYPLVPVNVRPSASLDLAVVPVGQGASQEFSDNQIEQALRQIWQNHFGYAQIGPDDNLSNLGGSSLDVISINAKIKKELKLDIPTAAMFQYPTISSLVKFIKTVRAAEKASIKPAKPGKYYLF